MEISCQAIIFGCRDLFSSLRIIFPYAVKLHNLIVCALQFHKRCRSFLHSKQAQDGKASLKSASAPKSGNKIVCLSFSVENVGSTDRHISYFDFECYADDAAAEAYYVVDDGLSATISAGRKASGNVYFEVPKDAQSIEVEYETDFWSGNKAIFVVK